jgi:hypothetical protein
VDYRRSLEAWLAVLLKPNWVFERLEKHGIRLSEGLLVAVISVVGYAAMNSLVSVAGVFLGNFSAGLSLSSLTVTVSNGFVDGAISLPVFLVGSFIGIHPLVYILGGRGYRDTMSMVLHASPAALLAPVASLLYEIFAAFVIGFPALRILGFLAALSFSVYVYARGIQHLHGMSFRRAILPPIMLSVLLVAMFVALFLLILNSFAATLSGF